jgi:hypothetical protein
MIDLPHISSSTFNKKIIIHDNLDEDKELLDLLNGKTLPASSSSRKRPMILPDPIPEEEESTITFKRKFTYDLPTISINKFKQTYKKKEKKPLNEANLYHSVNFSQNKNRLKLDFDKKICEERNIETPSTTYSISHSSNNNIIIPNISHPLNKKFHRIKIEKGNSKLADLWAKKLNNIDLTYNNFNKKKSRNMNFNTNYNINNNIGISNNYFVNNTFKNERGNVLKINNHLKQPIKISKKMM